MNKTIYILSLFTFLLILAILNGYLFNYINNTYFKFSTNENGLKEFSSFTKALIILGIAPIVETIVFQLIPNRVLKKMKVQNKYLLILFPSVLFGILHFYFWLFAISAFIGGLFLNYLYIKLEIQTNYYIVIVIVFHSMYNLYGYLFVT